MTLHLSQIGFTDARTFIKILLSQPSFGRKMPATEKYDNILDSKMQAEFFTFLLCLHFD